jgi:hypothetical protein
LAQTAILVFCFSLRRGAFPLNSCFAESPACHPWQAFATKSLTRGSL